MSTLSARLSHALPDGAANRMAMAAQRDAIATEAARIIEGAGGSQALHRKTDRSAQLTRLRRTLGALLGVATIGRRKSLQPS